jgi:hypothetical protein
VPLLVGAGHHEELHLHLLELAGPEDEVAGVISLRNDLPTWPMPNGGFLRVTWTTLAKLHEDALRGLRPEVVQPGLVLDDPEVGLEHHVEVTRLGPLAAGAAVRAGDLLRAAGGSALAGLELLLQMIGAEPPVAGQALGQRVAEDSDVAEATQTCRGRMTEESRPTTSSRAVTRSATTAS